MTIKNQLAKMYNTGALHISIGTFATKFVAFFGSIVVVRLLSKTEYGLMSYVENIYSYAFICAGLGLSNGLLRYLVKTDDSFQKKRVYNHIIKRSMIIDLMIAIILCLIAINVNFPNQYTSARVLIPVIALLLPFQDLLNEVLYTIRSFFKNKLYAYLAFGSSTALIIGRIIGAVSGGVKGVLWSRVIINAAFGIVIAVFVSRRFFPQEKVPKLSAQDKRSVNIYSFQYMITNGFWAIFMLNDAFLLGLLLNDPNALADYKVAYVLPGNLSIIAIAIGTFVGPYFTKNENNLEWVRRNFKKVFILSALAVAFVAGMIAVFAKPIILLMYGHQYLNIVSIMRALLLAAFLNSGIRYTTANVLAAMGEIRINMVASGAGIVIQVILDFILIPTIGIIAVAISNCVVFLMIGILLLVVFWRKYYKRNVSLQ